MGSNLFERLYRYRQKEGKHERENYLTELLAVVLERYPILISNLCERAQMDLPIGTSFRVHTQTSYAEGTPDIVIESTEKDTFILIECKLEAGEGYKQLERYQAIVQASEATYKAVIFLTKYYEPPRGFPITYLRWHHIFKLINQLPTTELLTLFSEYLICHHLHSPMTFTPIDLVALQQTQATIAKMDEVLSPLEHEFRKYLGSSKQYARSRSANLADGWYGYGRAIGSTNFNAGFRCSPGGIPVCFIEVERWRSVPLPENSPFQQALRQIWNIPDAKTTYLAIERPITAFLSTATIEEDTSVTAMREWFSLYFGKLNDTLVGQLHQMRS